MKTKKLKLKKEVKEVLKKILCFIYLYLYMTYIFFNTETLGVFLTIITGYESTKIITKKTLLDTEE